MQTFAFALVVLVLVLGSSLLDRWIPRLSLPLIQIAAGFGLALAMPGLSHDAASVEPELFLLLFVAPLLFDEARTISKRALARRWAPTLSLAIGLVAASTFAVGFVLHGLAPTIPLGAALALGAALGPTDAVAVGSLEGLVQLDRRQSATLSGEALLNDATGVVSFQFAVAFLAAGAISPTAVAGTFALSFVGGAVLGTLLGLACAWLLRQLHQSAQAPPAFYTVFDLLLPFVAFLLGEELHASGIICVVACAIALTIAPGLKSVATARVERLSHDLWEVVAFSLNGAVFVILGLQLPQAMEPSWTGPVSSYLLVALTAAVTATVMGVRFLWLWAQEALEARQLAAGGDPAAQGAGEKHAPDPGSPARRALLSTLAGPKGAITLSIAMTLPRFTVPGEAFPDRGALIFIASGVILTTLLLATFVLPVLAPPSAHVGHGMAAAEALVLEQLLIRLDEGIQLNESNEAQARALAITQRTYEHRLQRLREQELPWRERRARAKAVRRSRRAAAVQTRADQSWAAQPWAATDAELEQLSDLVAECEARSLHIELDVIRDLTIEGELTPEQARRLREGVYVMQITLAG